MRGVVQYQDFSDFNFFRDFERDFDRNTLRFIDSRAFVTGNWGPNLLNLLLDDREIVRRPARTDTLDPAQAPRAQVPPALDPRSARRRSTCRLDSSVDYLDVDRPGSGQGELQRAATGASTSSRR